MSECPVLLDDQAMQQFIRDGFITLKADLPAEIHTSVYEQATKIYETEGNPGNDILPRIPAMNNILNHPAIDGALRSILGPDYLLHPHRHGHLNIPGSDGQQHHKDSYEADQNMRHHHCRWVMGFYYPQDVDAERGPSSVLPASQYFCRSDEAHKREELPLYGPAGTFTIVHYDLWHRAMPNTGNLPRFMMKFLFCRMSEPTSPSWRSEGSPWLLRDTTGLEALYAHQWAWNHGNSPGTTQPDNDIDKWIEMYGSEHESCRLNAAYHLGSRGRAGVNFLMDSLFKEAEEFTESNLDKRHTNPSQYDAAYGLGAAGESAVPGLVDTLNESSWALRASAADILGDMGRDGLSAVSPLIKCLSDSSSWVRRNAAESLGIFGVRANEAAHSLAAVLDDPDPAVRLNAVSALQRIGPISKSAGEGLRCALNDETYFVRAHARIALDRLEAA